MSNLLRVRFHANEDDPRPVNWPVKHPYWVSGYGEGFAVVISYADNADYIYANWPEADGLEIESVNGYVFTDRFPRPDWFGEAAEKVEPPPPCPDCGRPMVRREPWVCAKCGEEMDA